MKKTNSVRTCETGMNFDLFLDLHYERTVARAGTRQDKSDYFLDEARQLEARGITGTDAGEAVVEKYLTGERA